MQKRSAKVLLVAIVTSLLIGSFTLDVFAAQKNDKLYIPIVAKGYQHQFWQAVKAGAEKAAKQFGAKVTFEGPENESQIHKQIEIFEAAIAKRPKAVCFAPLDRNAAIGVLEKCRQSNIAVLTFDSAVENCDIPVVHVATDNYAASAYAADKMASLIGGKGEVAVICFNQTSSTAIARRDGFINRINKKYPNIRVVDVQYGDGDEYKSINVAKSLVQAHPNIKGIFGCSNACAVGIGTAIREMNKVGKIVGIGYDSGKLQKDFVRNGVLAGSISQDPIGIGYKVVEAAIKVSNGEDVESFVDTGFKWYDKSNMDDEDIAPLLYE